MSDKLLGQTPSQTVGPYFAYGLTPEQYGYDYAAIAGPKLADESAPGQHIRIEGQVLDGQGAPVSDALIEIWQADANGVYGKAQGANSRFNGFGRCGTGTEADNRFWFDTVKPGVATAGDAPFINVIVMMRGMLVHAFTRLYFEDEAAANAADPVLSQVPEARRSTLVAKRTAPGVYRFDIRMQGEHETVFFDI